MTPKRIQDIDFQPSGADEAVDQFMPYYTPKGWIEAGRRVEAKNANRAQKMDDSCRKSARMPSANRSISGTSSAMTPGFTSTTTLPGWRDGARPA